MLVINMINDDIGGNFLKKITISLIAIICMIIFVSGCTGGTQTNNKSINTSSSNVTSSNGTVKITSPVNGATVPKISTVKGTVSTLNSGENLYVLIKSGNFSWWVQEKPVVSSDGTWECNVQYGEDADSGKEYNVCAIVTTETLNTKKEFGGTLPSLKYKDEVTVKRS